jgi:predicted histone-like DNA-binding protein
MAINYKVSKCKNPKGVEGTDYYSNKASKTSDYSFEDLAQDIAHSTTCTKADALAVLASIKPFIKNALLAGRRVVLNDLGYFVIGIRSKCFTKADMQDEEFTPGSKIKGYAVHFRPEPALKKELSLGIQFKRISSEAMA